MSRWLGPKKWVLPFLPPKNNAIRGLSFSKYVVEASSVIYRWQTCLLPLQDRERPGGKSVFTQLHNCHCITEEKGFCVTTTTQRFHFIDEHVYVVYRISRGVNNNLGDFESWKKMTARGRCCFKDKFLNKKCYF